MPESKEPVILSPEKIPQHADDTDVLVDKIIGMVKGYSPNANTDMIYVAYKLAKSAHSHQFRRSGAPYIEHPVQLAYIAAQLSLDATAISAALFHDVVEDTPYTYENIETIFGKSVAELVDGVTKLRKIKYNTREEQQVENLRKMFLAMAKDIRVVIIKLIDRLHNMRTLNFMPRAKQLLISKETLDVYAPLAHRLGMSKIKIELEDLALKYLDPVAYEEIRQSINQKKDEREKYIRDIMDVLREKLDQMNIKSQVTGRAKHFYSIFRKMYTQNKTIDELYDLFAVRIIVDTMIDCYNALGIVHDMFKPLPGRFKDYISMPKPNMYQSLHTTVLSQDGIPFEIQIRTWDMHRTAEYGIAAHWKYKLGKGGKDSIDSRLEWIHRMIEHGESTDTPEELVTTIKGDLSSEEVYVFTPRGDVKALSKGATVIDFAYAIHSAVGNKMVGAKVNGKIVHLDYKVKTGEIVEILTSNAQGKGPSRDWLNIVTTGEARSKIRSWFKKEKRDENIIQGKAEVERELKRNFIRLENDDYIKFVAKIAERQHFTDVDDFYAAVGYGGIQITRLMPGIKDEYNRNWKVQKEENKTPLASSNTVDKPRTSKDSSGVVVDGIDNCLIKMARCCSPIPGEEIIGFINRGTGLTIHRRDCVNVPEDLKNCPEPERWVGAHWDGNVKVDARSTIDVYAIDRDGMVLDITTCLANSHVKIHSINARPINDGNCLTTMTITVNSKEHLDSIEKSIRKIEGVYHIERSAI